MLTCLATIMSVEAEESEGTASSDGSEEDSEEEEEEEEEKRQRQPRLKDTASKRNRGWLHNYALRLNKPLGHPCLSLFGTWTCKKSEFGWHSL